MSLFRSVNVKCPNCEEEMRIAAVGSVNADRRPDLRAEILENTFQEFICASCGETSRLQPEFNYLHAGGGLWIAAMPATRFPYYLEHEDEAVALFEETYGAKAPARAQDVGQTLDVRVTFGWPAVREKLLLREHDLDDVIVEMMKMDLLRKLPSAPLAPGVELRLVRVTESDFVFVWLRTASEEAIEEFTTPVGWYKLIADDPEPWGAVRAQIDNGPFVDMQKIYMGPGRAAAAE